MESSLEGLRAACALEFPASPSAMGLSQSWLAGLAVATYHVLWLVRYDLMMYPWQRYCGITSNKPIEAPLYSISNKETSRVTYESVFCELWYFRPGSSTVRLLLSISYIGHADVLSNS